jgi:hypothetical protein
MKLKWKRSFFANCRSQSEGRTDGQTDGRTDGQTERVTILTSFFASQRTPHTVYCILQTTVLLGIKHTGGSDSATWSKKLYIIIIIIIIIISIIPVITFMHGIYNYTPETNHVSRVHAVTAVL